MKFKVINRSAQGFTRERSQDVPKLHRNLDPLEHPFERAREYVAALNAAKLDRVFAKPFLAALPHPEAVTCMARNPKRLGCLVSGTADGDIMLWDMPEKRCLRRLKSHRGAVRGLSITPNGDSCVSCGADSTVKFWKLPLAPFQAGPLEEESRPVMEFQGSGAFRGLDHHWEKDMFVTCGAAIDIWTHERTQPIKSFTWGSDSVVSVRFNPVDTDLLASTATDRSISLYDLRLSTPMRKLVMQTRSNALAWNPMEAMSFVVANEDSNLYSYDLRRLDTASKVHKGFVSAVMDVDYSPTGREFVAGSYDRSIRIFPFRESISRDVYTTQRMQRVFSVRFSGDATYVISGSDDMNVRIWKVNASEPLGVLHHREERKLSYGNALLRRYRHMPEIRKIVQKRHLPQPIFKAVNIRREQRAAEFRREENVIKHSAPGSVVKKPTKKRKIVAQVE